MMICPETFYDNELKGKSYDEILRVIRRLKREISRLKRIMEHPDYDSQQHMLPDESTRLWCTRLYLARAKEALAETGTHYEPTSAELRVMDFDANIKNIRKIKLTVGGFFEGYSTYTISLEESLHFSMDKHSGPISLNTDTLEEFPMTKEEFFESFAELHIGEWRKYYDPECFGYMVMDGTQWELKIEYNNGSKAFTSAGSNAFPYNFKKLTELFGIEEDAE